jgi:hypothetical protein
LNFFDKNEIFIINRSWLLSDPSSISDSQEESLASDL